MLNSRAKMHKNTKFVHKNAKLARKNVKCAQKIPNSCSKMQIARIIAKTTCAKPENIEIWNPIFWRMGHHKNIMLVNHTKRVFLAEFNSRVVDFEH